MKILVPVKRVIDYNVRVRVKSDNSGVECDGVKMSMNPFDEIALEEALRLKEAGIAHEVIALSIGGAGVVETLRTALAMGADTAIHLHTEIPIEPLAAAKLIKTQVEATQARMVIAGKQAIDDDANQTGQMLAALLEWGLATFASKVTIEGEQVTVMREVDGGLMTVQTTLPCVITTDLRLNQPRYASLPNIMKARSKPLTTIEASTLGIDLAPRLTIEQVTPPIPRQGGVKVKTVDELVTAIKAIME